MKLGRKAVKTDSRTLRLARYLTAALPPPPVSCDWTKSVTDFGVMLNDNLGDCTIAACGHAVQIWSLSNVGLELTVTDSDILAAYEAWDGYNPADPSTDQGGICLDVLTNWKKNSLAGHALLGFAIPSVSNLTELKQAVNLFGGLYIGMSVPNFIMNPAPPPLWDVVADDGGIDGGHCVFCCGYDEDTISFISWGRVYKMTTAYWAKYVDEAYALLSSVFIGSNGAPNGFDLDQLTADLSAIN